MTRLDTKDLSRFREFIAELKSAFYQEQVITLSNEECDLIHDARYLFDEVAQNMTNWWVLNVGTMIRIGSAEMRNDFIIASRPAAYIVFEQLEDAKPGDLWCYRNTDKKRIHAGYATLKSDANCFDWHGVVVHRHDDGHLWCEVMAQFERFTDFFVAADHVAEFKSQWRVALDYVTSEILADLEEDAIRADMRLGYDNRPSEDDVRAIGKHCLKPSPI